MKLILQFLFLSLLLSGCVFRDALLGGKIIAPLDIAVDFFSEYQYLDPHADGIPENHYIIDQLTYDLPLQKTIYDSYHRGEIPWWTPYTFGGRPLLADAHCNGTDPIRLLCYALLPFELAYNWNFILRGIVTGLGMLCLLRHLRIPPAVVLLVALSAQFAGCFALYIGHPWIQASMLYFPFLWIVFDTYLERPRSSLLACGGLIVGMIFLSGNLQSHAYAVVFCLLWLVAVLIARRQLFPRALLACAVCGLIGSALALPVLANQLELYSNSIRIVSPSPSGHLGFLGGFFPLSFPHPFFLGTFRSFDIGKLADQNSSGFHLFIGAGLAISALIGGVEIFGGPHRKNATPGEWLALLLPLAHLFICSTPLARILYPRIAPLGVFGLLVLSAFGLRKILGGELSGRGLYTGRFACGLFGLMILLHTVLVPLIYPRGRSILEAHLKEGNITGANNDPLGRLRLFQLDNFIHETTLQNPEVVVSLVTFLTLLAALFLRGGKRRLAIFATLCCNLILVMMFYARFIPLQPMSLWTRLLEGGPKQTMWAGILNPNHSRLTEGNTAMSRMIFPNEMGNFWMVHTVYGYAALQPPSIFRWPNDSPAPAPNQIADFDSTSDDFPRLESTPGDEGHRVMSRYSWIDSGNKRPLRIAEESLNHLSLSIAPGQTGEILRTDTTFPGWSALWNGHSLPLQRTGPVFSKVEVPASETDGVLEFRYSPTYLRPATLVCLAGLVLVAGLMVFSFLGKRL